MVDEDGDAIDKNKKHKFKQGNSKQQHSLYQTNNSNSTSNLRAAGSIASNNSK